MPIYDKKIGFRSKAVLCVPVISPQLGVIAVIVASNKVPEPVPTLAALSTAGIESDHPTFTYADVQALEMISCFAAMWMTNQQLVKRLQDVRHRRRSGGQQPPMQQLQSHYQQPFAQARNSRASMSGTLGFAPSSPVFGNAFAGGAGGGVGGETPSGFSSIGSPRTTFSAKLGGGAGGAGGPMPTLHTQQPISKQ